MNGLRRRREGTPRIVSSGLVCWYHLFDPTAALSSIADSSHGANPLTFGTSSPAWDAGGAGLVFTSDDCVSNATQALNADFTVMLVALLNGTTGRVCELSYSATQLQAVGYNGSGKILFKSTASSTNTSGDLAVSTSAPGIIVVQNTAGTITMKRLDTGASVTIASKQAPYTGKVFIGKKYDGSSVGDAQTLYDYLLYSRSLSATEITANARELARLWRARGLTVPFEYAPGTVLFTFDGGSTNTYNVAYPILAAAGFKGTV
jgi:hypothetical protein